VDNAASTGTTGLKWFKVAHDGLSGGKWAVDTMIANGGWHYFTMPTCVAPGDYLMRVELIALHNAGTAGTSPVHFCDFLDDANVRRWCPILHGVRANQGNRQWY
jgi:hypothetical protein